MAGRSNLEARPTPTFGAPMGTTPVNPARVAESEAMLATEPAPETRRRLIEQQVQEGQQFQQRQPAERQAGARTGAPKPEPEDKQTSGTKDLTIATAMDRVEGAEGAVDSAMEAIKGIIGSGAGAAGGR